MNESFEDTIILLDKNPCCLVNYIESEHYYEFAMNVVSKTGKLNYCSNKLKDDINIVTEAVKVIPCAFEAASTQLRGNYDIAIKALNIRYNPLRFCSDELKDNFDFVMECIRVRGDVLSYISDNLKDNYEIIKEAVASSSHACFAHASIRLREDFELSLFAISKHSSNFLVVSPSLKNDYDFCMKAVKYKGVLAYVPEIHRRDFYINMESVSKSGRELENVHPNFVDNMEIALFAIEKSKICIVNSISKKLIKEPDILLKILLKYKEIFAITGYNTKLSRETSKNVIRALENVYGSRFFVSPKTEKNLTHLLHKNLIVNFLVARIGHKIFYLKQNIGVDIIFVFDVNKFKNKRDCFF